jgi:hypothetical protein
MCSSIREFGFKIPVVAHMKPVELVDRALVNNTKTGDVVVDLFGGSGSTLIASFGPFRSCAIFLRWSIATTCTVLLPSRSTPDSDLAGFAALLPWASSQKGLFRCRIVFVRAICHSSSPFDLGC